MSEPQAIVKQPETQDEDAVTLRGLLEGNGKFLEIAPDGPAFAPHRFPRLIEKGGIHLGNGKSLVKSRGVLELDAQSAGLEHHLVAHGKRVVGFTRRAEGKFQDKLAIGGMDALRPDGQLGSQKAKEDADETHGAGVEP